MILNFKNHLQYLYFNCFCYHFFYIFLNFKLKLLPACYIILTLTSSIHIWFLPKICLLFILSIFSYNSTDENKKKQQYKRLHT